MARIGEKVNRLVAEDGEMEEAIEAVLDRAADGEEVEWSDVRDDLTSGQWGRLIETGVLVDGDEGFKFDDREAVEDALHGEFDLDLDFDDIEETTWTKWDKGAAVASIALFAGYTLESVRETIGQGVGLFLSPIEANLPFYGVILVIALLTGLYSTLLQANLMDPDKMGQYQQRMKAIQEKQQEAKESGDEAAMEQIRQEQMEAMADQLGMFKEQFRPMVWIMLLTIPFFLWMWWRIRDGPIGQETIVVPVAGEVMWLSGLVGPIQMWIVWYFFCSMGFTQLLRKVLNIDMTPTTA